MLQRFLLLWLLLGSLTALFWPAVGSPVDPFLAIGKDGIKWLLVVIMFCIGLLLPVAEVNAVFTRWWTVLGGTTVQYLVMPSLAYASVSLFQPDPQTAAGIMIVGCVPGAMASNVLTLAARGNVSYSVSLTSSATLLSPFVVPLVLGMTIDGDVEYDGGTAVRVLVTQVVLPVVGGHLLRRLIGELPGSILRLSGVIANLAILAVIAIAVALQRETLGQVSMGLLGVLAAINVGGYAAGYFSGFGLRIAEPMRRALTLEVGMQNAGAGIVLATQLFGENSVAIIPCILYTFGCMLTGTILATAWSWSPPASEPNLPS